MQRGKFQEGVYRIKAVNGNAQGKYSTDRNFQKNNGLKKIKKGSVNKIIAKTTLSKLEKNRTYYFRVRLWDGNGKCSKWSKTVRVRMKKS